MYALIPIVNRQKLDSQSAKSILIGFDEDAGSKVYYKLFSPAMKRVVSLRDVIIDDSISHTRSQVKDELQLLREIETSLPKEKEKERTRQSGAMPIE